MSRSRHDQWDAHFLNRSLMFEPLYRAAHTLNQFEHWPTLDQLNQLIATHYPSIHTHNSHLLRLVAQSESIEYFEQQYEPRTYLCGELQTREQNWHDLFNALVWMTFPYTKATLNALHYHDLKTYSAHHHPTRGQLRDAITLLDESGVLVTSSDDHLTQLLKNFEWKTLFWEHRSALCKHMKFYLFGHGLYEKALSPYVGMTGKGLIFRVEPTFYQKNLTNQIMDLDSKLANLLSSGSITSGNLTPVPLLGYPDWSPDNRNAAYYENTNYFRPRSNKYLLKDRKFKIG